MLSIFACVSSRCAIYRRFSSAAREVSGRRVWPELMSNVDSRPVPLSRTVELLVNLGDLDSAAEYARLAALNSNKDALDLHSTSTCDTIIGAMCEAKRYRDAVDLYHYFFNESEKKPSYESSDHIIQALCEQGYFYDPINLFHDISISSWKVRPLAYRNIISGWLNQGMLDMAIQLLEEFESAARGVGMDYNDVAIARVAFIEHWLKQGKDEEAMRWYFSLRGKVYWGDTGNALLEVLLRHGKKTLAWELFHQMLDGYHSGCISVNSKTIDLMVNDCFEGGRFRQGIDTFEKVKAKVNGQLSALDYTRLITRCCEHGMLEEAESLYHELLSSNSYLDIQVSTYRAMMDAYYKAGRVDDARQMAKTMVDVNLTKLASWMRF